MNKNKLYQFGDMIIQNQHLINLELMLVFCNFFRILYVDLPIHAMPFTLSQEFI
jgi:hypothetical protein